MPGHDAVACKGMAESLLFEKAVGTKSNYFGGYIEVRGVSLELGDTNGIGVVP